MYTCGALRAERRRGRLLANILLARSLLLYMLDLHPDLWMHDQSFFIFNALVVGVFKPSPNLAVLVL